MRYGRPRPRRRPVRRRKPVARLRPTGNPRRRVKRRKPKRNPVVASKRAKSYTISAKEWEAELARRRRSRAAKKGVATKAKKGKKKNVAQKKAAAKRKKAGVKKATSRRPRSAASYKAAARKAAATRKKKAAARSAAAKKAAATRKKKKARPVSKKRKSPKKTAAKQRGKLTKAQRRAAALKGWRKKRRTKMARTVGKRRKSYKHKRKYAYSPRRRKPIGNQKVRRGYKGRRSRRKGRGGKKRTYGRIYRKVDPYMRKGRKVRKHRKNVGIRINPMTALKRMVKEGVYTFGGILGIRVLCKVLQTQVFARASSTFSTGAMAKIAPMLPAGVAMLLAALAPKVIKGSPKLVQGLQAGATLVFFDAALESVLKAVDPKGSISQYLLPGAPAPAVSGWGAYHEYVGAPMGSPMGLEVESAMAMDEYVSSPVGLLGSGMGGEYDVEEALAGNEGQAFETGYAGGSLAKTVFSNY